MLGVCDYCGRENWRCPTTGCGMITCRDWCSGCGFRPTAVREVVGTDFTRTAAAIGAYDAYNDRMDVAERAGAVKSSEQMQAIIKEHDQLAEAVGIALGQDTACFNDPETCRKLVRPGPKVPPPGCELSPVRRWVAKWKESNQ